MMARVAALVVALLIRVAAGGADAPPPTPREALKPLNILVGSWKGTGTPDGTAEEKQKGHWVETVACEWQFKEADAWLTLKFEKGKLFSSGELRAKRDGVELTLKTPADEVQTFSGQVKGKQLVVERTIAESKTVERLTFSLLHENRVVYRVESKPASGTLWTKRFQVGMTKEGVPFAETGASARECVVSGGLGTIPVTFEGKTYYVCCSGCRDEFKASPAKYVKEFEAKRKK